MHPLPDVTQGECICINVSQKWAVLSFLHLIQQLPPVGSLLLTPYYSPSQSRSDTVFFIAPNRNLFKISYVSWRSMLLFAYVKVHYSNMSLWKEIPVSLNKQQASLYVHSMHQAKKTLTMRYECKMYNNALKVQLCLFCVLTFWGMMHNYVP